MERSSGNTILARILGILAFVVGIAILVFVFFQAYNLFSAPPPGLAADSTSGPTTANLSTSAVTLLMRIGVLFIMTLVGSLIAGRGVQLYLGCPETTTKP